MGNLDFTNHPGFSWYCLLLMASGLAMLAIGAVAGQARGARIANLIAGAGFVGYGWYLTFLFQGGSYFVFFKAFILPALSIISGIRSIAATRRARARATVTPPGIGGVAYASPAGLQPAHTPAEPAEFTAGRAGTGYPATVPPARRPRRLMGVTAGLAVLVAAGIGIGVAFHHSVAGSSTLPGTLLGMPKYTGLGGHAEDARLARQAQAASDGHLVHVIAAIYGNPSASGRAFAVAEGAFCDTCSISPARSRARARLFPPGPGGGYLTCFSYQVQGQTDFGCSRADATARIGIKVAYAPGAASSLADAAAKTRQITAAIARQP